MDEHDWFHSFHHHENYRSPQSQWSSYQRQQGWNFALEDWMDKPNNVTTTTTDGT
jgi:hypothetical protein